MDTQRLTTKSREVIAGAVALAGQRSHAVVEAWHLLLSLLDTGGSTASGLLRAVGMTRSQVRATVRWESVITSMLGAVLGVVLGLISGYLLVLSLRDEGITVFTVPVLSTIVILFVSFIVGVIAAVIPARRATKVDIIEAIATT